VLVHNSGDNNGRVSVLLNELAGGGHRREILGDGETAGLDFRIGVIAPADFNSSGQTDGADFLHWQRGFGKLVGALRSDGDANADGRVDATDFGLWKGALGGGTVSSSDRFAESEIESTVPQVTLQGKPSNRLAMLVAPMEDAQSRPNLSNANIQFRRRAFAKWTVAHDGATVAGVATTERLTGRRQDNLEVVDQLLEMCLNWRLSDDAFTINAPLAVGKLSKN
jgi:hypothetical protein